MGGTNFYNFSTKDVMASTKFNSNFDWIEGDIVPHLAGVKTDLTYNLGETTYRWNNVYAQNIHLQTAGSLYFWKENLTDFWGIKGSGSAFMFSFYNPSDSTIAIMSINDSGTMKIHENISLQTSASIIFDGASGTTKINYTGSSINVYVQDNVRMVIPATVTVYLHLTHADFRGGTHGLNYMAGTSTGTTQLFYAHAPIGMYQCKTTEQVLSVHRVYTYISGGSSTSYMKIKIYKKSTATATLCEPTITYTGSSTAGGFTNTMSTSLSFNYYENCLIELESYFSASESMNFHQLYLEGELSYK